MNGLLKTNQLVAPYFQRPLQFGSLDRLRETTCSLGPAFIASIAYIDPGNFAANIFSASHSGYRMLWLILWGNAMGLIFQTLACRLGIFSNASLATNCGLHLPSYLKIPLWICSEIMAIATDLAEVVGAGLGISMLCHTALFQSCLIAALLSFLPFLKKRRQQSFIEKLMFLFLIFIGGLFAFEIYLSQPDPLKVSCGTLVPSLKGDELLIAASMLGATVMPHIVFLHSSLMKNSGEANPEKRYRIAIIDNCTALNFAWIINSAIVILFAAVFAKSGIHGAEISISGAANSISTLFGPAAYVAFAVALIIAGISSTTVGSMAGQEILDGFFNIRIPVALKRLATLIPSLVIVLMGLEPSKLLLYSQVALSFALPFTLIPLISFNCSEKIMGKHRLKGLLLMIAVTSGLLITVLNGFVVFGH